MTDAIETKIAELLLGRLEGFAIAVTLPVAWPNIVFSPPAGTYLKADLLWNRNINRGVSNASSTQHRGILQVSVVAPAGTGLPGPTNIAGDIAAHFDRVVLMSGGGPKVKVDGKPSLSPALQETDRIRIPVSIPFRAFA